MNQASTPAAAFMVPSDPFDAPGVINTSPYGQRLAMPRFALEEDLATWVLGQVAAHFHIQKQVYGTHCSGSRLRIDAVLRPKDTSGWADGPDTAIGVEFKRSNGGRAATQWIAQCVDYGHVEWDGYGRLPIFACPGVRVGWSDDADKAVGHLLGQMRIGELVKLHKYGWSLLLHTHHRQWSETEGVVEARRTRLRPKIGSR